MKKLLAILALTLGTVIVAPRATAASEQISSYRSDITVNQDATVDITETIVYDFGSPTEARHGIIRTIPAVKTNTDGKRFKLDYTLKSITDQSGRPYDYTDQSTSTQLEAKVGSASVTVSGEKTYVIRYQVAGAITYFSDHDEFYWNATGTEWTVPIAYSQVTVTLPSSVITNTGFSTCYTGVSGSSAQRCTIQTTGNGAVITSEGPLASSEGLTAVVGFPIDKIAHVEPVPYTDFFDTTAGKIAIVIFILIGICWYIVLPGYIIRNWFKHGRDPKVDGPVTAWFDPPKLANGRPLTPGETGTVIDETAGMPEVTATVIHLAQRGYLKIVEKVKKDFYLTKEKEYESDATILPFELELLKGFFQGKTELKLKDADLALNVQNAQKKMYTQCMDNGYFTANPQTTRIKYTVIGVFGLATGNIPLLIAAFGFGIHMASKTRIGAEAATVAKGLKNFLSSQQRQLEFQADKQMMFEKLLPYAIAFGVEKVWAKRFEGIDLTQPGWYQGYNNTSLFTAMLLTDSLNHSFSQFRSAATPTKSSSGFSSGFSGGFSGGGGGGGGGGSW